MKITWLGHACFRVEEGDYAVVLDPYTAVRGYPALAVSADKVLCSHAHFDHNYKEAVTVPLRLRPSPFTVETMDTFHDERQGALRGSNTVHILRCGGKTLVHLGDLGHSLSRQQAEKIHGCDVLLLPVGGVYTINAQQAKTVAEQVAPKIVVPMHYRHDPYGLENVAGVEEFLRLFPDSAVERLAGSAFTPESVSGTVIVPHYPV